MKLDASVMRTMSKEDYRVLLAIEIGMKTHELVPAKVCISIAKLRHGGANKVMGGLLRDKLLSHDGSKGYDGYRLTNSGYDILALKSLTQKGVVSAIGDKIGIGKESDIYIAATSTGRQVVLKFHRLGRTSFRAVRKQRDYLNNTKSGQGEIRPPRTPGDAPLSNNSLTLSLNFGAATNWLFMSRLSAVKEFAFMKALHGVGYPTPEPLDHSRHVVAMSLVRGCPLYQIRTRNEVSTEQAQSIFEQSVHLAKRLAKHGLVHCDLNEFNLMVDLSGIQQDMSGDGIGDHYVRHSGAVLRGPGALSAHGALGKESQVDGTGEKIVEAAPVPKELLGNGDPKPIVTLIDFPQMVSIKHPNAHELYDRDVQCLIRFFKNKLQCYIQNEDGTSENMDMAEGWRFEDVVKGMGVNDGEEEETAEDDEEELLEEETLLEETEEVPKKRKGKAGTVDDRGRLDTNLQASGHCGKKGGDEALELYYFERDRAKEEVELGEGEGDYEEEEEEEEEEDEDENEQEDPPTKEDTTLPATSDDSEQNDETESIFDFAQEIKDAKQAKLKDRIQKQQNVSLSKTKMRSGKSAVKRNANKKSSMEKKNTKDIW